MGTLLEPSSPRLDPPPSPGQRSPRGGGEGRAAAPHRGYYSYDPTSGVYKKGWAKEYDAWEQYNEWWYYAPWTRVKRGSMFSGFRVHSSSTRLDAARKTGASGP